MCCRLAMRGSGVTPDLILEWYISDPGCGFVGVGSEVWHGGIGSALGDSDNYIIKTYKNQI